MVRLVAAMMVALMVLAGTARAEEPEGDGVLEKAMRKDPDRFAERAVDLIAGFGAADGLRPEGIEEHIALKRAGARASALRRFHAMDLDGDGEVDRGELSVSQRAASAASRGRLERQFALADGDGDGRIDAGELKAEGQTAAFRALDEAEAEVLRALMTLDADGDGALQSGELAAAVARVGEET